MDNYLGVLALRLLLHNSCLTEQERRSNNLIENVRQIKADIRKTKDAAKVYDLVHLITSDHKDKLLFDTILEDDFLEWMLDTLESYENRKGEQGMTIWMLILLTNGTNYNVYFAKRLLSLQKLWKVIHILIRVTSLSENIRDYLILILANVTFNVDETVVVSDEVKEFLLQNSQSDLKVVSVVTWMKLASEKEREREKNLICLMIPQLIQDLESSYMSETLHSFYCSFSENLNFLDVMCECKEARDVLSSNFKVLMLLRLILTNNNLKDLIGKVDQLLDKLYNHTQVKHLKENVATIRR